MKMNARLSFDDSVFLTLDEEEKIDLDNEDIFLPKVCAKDEFMKQIEKIENDEVPELIKNHEKAFNNDCGRISDEFAFKIKLEESQTKPINIPPRRIPMHHYEEVRRQIIDLEKRGIIERSSSPWSFPVVLTSKSNGELRICIDFRELNKRTVKEATTIPQFEELRNRLHSATTFTALDLSQGYWHTPVDAECKDLLSFCPGPGLGNWSFNVMPFGPKNSPSHFQRIMTRLFGDLHYVFIYIDDILIFSDNQKEHLIHLKEVMSRCIKFGLRVKLSKCKFSVPEVEYLGHSIGKGMYFYKDKTKHILQNYSLPTTYKELEAFIGLINYYRVSL